MVSPPSPPKSIIRSQRDNYFPPYSSDFHSLFCNCKQNDQREIMIEGRSHGVLSIVAFLALFGVLNCLTSIIHSEYY